LFNVTLTGGFKISRQMHEKYFFDVMYQNNLNVLKTPKNGQIKEV